MRFRFQREEKFDLCGEEYIEGDTDMVWVILLCQTSYLYRNVNKAPNGNKYSFTCLLWHRLIYRQTFKNKQNYCTCQTSKMVLKGLCKLPAQ